MIAALFAGIIVGLIHVLSGPDHLSAIAPIASVERRRVWTVGLRWGLGHSLGVMLVGLVAAFLAHAALVDPLSATSERLVGGMLLAIGAWGFWRLGRSDADCGAGAGADAATAAVTHTHADDPPHTHGPADGRRFAPYAIGILHGCAGGSHLVGILLALAFPTLAGVLTYLAGFVAGSVLAMCAFAAGIGWLSAIGGVSSRLQRGMVILSSLASIGIGLWWLLP